MAAASNEPGVSGSEVKPLSTLELYQESVPFSNERLDRAISSNQEFSNPIIVPFAFDFTTALNTLECVIYVKNTSTEFRYENVVVSMIESTGQSFDNEHAYIERDESDNMLFILNRKAVRAKWAQVPDLPFFIDSSFMIISHASEGNGYSNSCRPVGDDEKLSVKFSYGYDEISSVEWESKGSVLIIPAIGRVNVPDTSYHPIRVRVTWKDKTKLFTIRDYSIDISYQRQRPVAELELR